MLLLVILLTVLGLVALRGVIVMLLWNWLMPMLLHLPEISFLESLGLVLLAGFLFGSIIDKNVIPKSDKKANLTLKG